MEYVTVAFIVLIGALGAVLALGWMGLQVKPKPFPPYPEQTPPLSILPLPADLPPAAPGEIREAAVRARRHWHMWVELVTNVIPGVNDAEDTLEAIAAWIARDLGPDTPWHLTRFHPAYQMEG